jgi:hypothetical protein
MDFIRSGDVCVISTSLVKTTGLMYFIKSYRIADFVQYSPALQKFTSVVDFIRSGGLCVISTSLANNYQSYGLYKAW